MLTHRRQTVIHPILKALAAGVLAALCAVPAMAQAPAQGAPASAAPATPRTLKKVGVTLGSLGNPYFVALARGAEAAARQVNPKVKVTVLSADYDLNKQ
jgi:ribose transport system substrate-binding protein